MWMFFMDVMGYIPMGNDGQIKVPARTANNPKALKGLAKSFEAGRRGTIYTVASWTQEMSELGPAGFERYIVEHGKKVDV